MFRNNAKVRADSLKKTNKFISFGWGMVASIGVIAALFGGVLPAEVSAQTLQLKFGFEDGGTTTTNSVAGAGVSLNIVNGTNAADFHGAAGSGVAGAGKALDFSSGTYGNATSPLAFVTNSGAVNFGAVSNFTMTQWIKPGALSQFPRFFLIGTNT